MTANNASAKFRRQAQPVLGRDRSADLLSLLWHADELDVFTALFATAVAGDRI